MESVKDGFSSVMEISQESMSRITGAKDENIQLIEERYPVRITVRGGMVAVVGPDREPVAIVSDLIGQMSRIADKGDKIRPSEVRYCMDMIANKGSVDMESLYDGLLCMTARGKPVRPKTIGQRAYVKAIRDNDIVFTVGPAGTGKTYLAVCEAVNMLKAGTVSRIVLVRPAVEAGESLGFLPGDLKEKVEPYLRPLYDAFFELLTPERFMRYVDKNVIEVAPLAYMRGRTLNDSFIILDEAQNTTPEQMKMFITRMGFGSKAVITGDLTQVDLPAGRKSGLFVVQDILKGIKGIDFIRLENVDVVRHQIVQRVVAAYEEYEKRTQ
ncbi:phosphate starvation-inducible protein PhoH [Dethiosulfovibrio salsuginis]|uniref:PhoH-like protein n=2 Tax=Dethiosulfovibrio salsuginis TaxID=561720 RepID=A0A1X7KT95_9BACT|nr:phosphate starvation-inducible protein PhoH [Dethiosulfovibrio salsuginis]